MLLLCQFLISLWHNTYTLLDVYPKRNTCACDSVSTDGHGIGISDWLQCFCYIPKEGEIFHFAIPITNNTEDLCLVLEVQIQILLGSNCSLTTNETESKKNVNLVNSTTVIKDLKAETLLGKEGVFAGFTLVLVLIYTPLSAALFSFIPQMFINSIKPSVLLGLHDFVSIMFMGVDQFALLVQIYNNAPFFAHNKDSLTAPIVLLSIVMVFIFCLGVFKWHSLQGNLNTNLLGQVDDSNTCADISFIVLKVSCEPLLVLLCTILLIANRTHVAHLLVEDGNFPALDLPVFLMVEIFNLFGACTLALKQEGLLAFLLEDNTDQTED